MANTAFDNSAILPTMDSSAREIRNLGGSITNVHATNTQVLTSRTASNHTRRNLLMQTNGHTGNLTMQSINTCGLKAKFDFPNFCNELKQCDISFITETKTDDTDIECISSLLNSMNLKVYFKNRCKIATFRSGGLCIIYNSNIEQYLTYIESKNDISQWIKVSKHLLGTDKDVIFGNIYIPPENTRYANPAPFEYLKDDILKFDNYHICMVGDFNAHTGKGPDHTVSSDYSVDQLTYDLEAQAFINSINILQNNNISITRDNGDQSAVNSYGSQLLDFCKFYNLFIANGRLSSDNTGKATTIKNTLIDYLLGGPHILTRIENFHVHDFDAIFSDMHRRLTWSIQCHKINHIGNSKNNTNLITIKKTHKNMWRNSKSAEFSNSLDTNEIIAIRNNINNPNIPLDGTIKNLQTLFKSTADVVLGPEREFQIDTNRKSKPLKFDRQTLNLRNKYYMIKRINNGSNEMKLELQNASKAYKKAVAKAKAISKKQKIKKLKYSKNNDRKYYWSILNNKNNHKIRNSKNVPTPTTFFNGFKNLASGEDHGEFINEANENLDHNLPQTSDLSDQILNSEFTEEEISKCVQNLKNGKACGDDQILNEYIISSYDELKLVYVDLFNRILNDGRTPESWLIGMIIPLPKSKGDSADFNNYRAITLLSCLGKLFTSVINSRLETYSLETNLILENQAGFRKGYSTTDHLFLLKNFIDIFVKNQNHKLYCAFVDYKKAFDTIWRSGLWYKMIQAGIRGKLFNVIFNMYDNIKSCVNVDGNMSDYFISINGVRQGENLSPFLFALFVNDIEKFLVEYGCNPVKVEDVDIEAFIKLLVIMYADDTVLFAKSKEELQNCLNGLKSYCDKWKLQINAEKTKVIIFAKRKVNPHNLNFKIGDKNVEIVDEFCYLGVTFTHTGNFSANFKMLERQGNSALFGIVKQSRRESLPIETQFELFDMMVFPVILYGAEIWGFSNLTVLERLHLKFCKIVLKLKKSTPDAMVYGETGRFDIVYYAKKRIVNFWSRIVLGKEDKLCYNMYKLCKQLYFSPEGGTNSTQWFLGLSELLRHCGIDHIPEEVVEVKAAVKHVQLVLKSEYVLNWERQVNSQPKCDNFYKHVKSIFEREYYLTSLPYNLRIAMSRIRTCNHKLPIEVGRYARPTVPREQRVYTKCNSGQMGDEYHFILTCTNPTLITLTERYISPHYTGSPKRKN